MDLTYRMYMLLDVIVKRNNDGSYKDLDQIVKQVEYKVTKQSAQHTLRAMRKRGVIQKGASFIRRGRRRVTYSVTESGYAALKH